MFAEENHPPLLEHALAAASRQLGTEVTAEGGLLPGGNRSVVVRARRADSHETVIVKGYDASRSGEGWVREAAALTALTGLGTSAPAVLGVVDAPPVVVMEDLGPGDSLATALLGDRPEAAERATTEWAEALADLHAATWNDVGGFERALADLAGPLGADADAMPGVLADGVERLRGGATLAGVEVDDQVAAEIRDSLGLIGDDVRVLSPFDACPDNNVRTDTGTRLIDFEGATVAHPAWDIAYLTVPWPTCWCAWRLPDATADRAQAAWRARLTHRLGVRGVIIDWPAMEDAVLAASLVWCLVTVGWFLPGAQADRHAGGAGSSSPRLRAVIQHRLGLVATSDRPDLPASRDLARRLSAALARDWQRESLPLAPAFRPPTDEGQRPPTAP